MFETIAYRHLLSGTPFSSQGIFIIPNVPVCNNFWSGRVQTPTNYTNPAHKYKSKNIHAHAYTHTQAGLFSAVCVHVTFEANCNLLLSSGKSNRRRVSSRRTNSHVSHCGPLFWIQSRLYRVSCCWHVILFVYNNDTGNIRRRNSGEYFSISFILEPELFCIQ